MTFLVDPRTKPSPSRRVPERPLARDVAEIAGLLMPSRKAGSTMRRPRMSPRRERGAKPSRV